MGDQDPKREQLEERVMELELRSEFQKKEIDQLDEVLQEYADRVAKLEMELRRLRRQLSQLSPDVSIGDASVLES